MEETREVLEFTIGLDEFDSFIEERQPTILHETLCAVEDIIYNDREYNPVFNINVVTDGGVQTMICGVHRFEIEHSLEKVLEKALDSEEYEMCQRVKDLRDYISEHDIKLY